MSRILLISDLHGNLEALRAVVDNVRYDHVLCMGDLVDYGPDPAACIDWIRENRVPTVRGNHDNAVALHVDCRCGYEYKHLSIATREYSWSSLGERDLDFLARLPLTIDLDIDGISFLLAHGSPASFFDYIYPDIPQEQLDKIVEAIHQKYLVVGHTHKPAILFAKRIKILNPGSVGQPRDGDPRASCMILNTKTREAEIIRISYDMETTCHKIRSAMPHPSELEAILKRGF